jgi:GT2 family glycosyltransferase
MVEKRDSYWKNSVSENLELARQKAVGNYFVIVDADMVLPQNFLERLLPQLSEFASVSAIAQTDGSQGLMNRLVSVWEGSYRFAPFGQQPRGGARAITRKSLDAIGGFRDVIAWDTDVDIRLRQAGYKVKLDIGLRVSHRRKMSLRRSIAYQVQAGKARRELGVSFARTLLHSIARIRPFVLYGYVKGRNRISREGP